MNTLEQRIAMLERLIQKIIALPHLSNLAGRDSKNFIARLNLSIADDKEKLASDNLTDDERKEIASRITRNEFLVSPALFSELHDTETKESTPPKLVTFHGSPSGIIIDD